MMETEAEYITPSEQVGGDHYKRMKIDVYEFAETNGLTPMEFSAVKYICRNRFKNGREDLLKAQHTINRIIEHYYNDSNEHHRD